MKPLRRFRARREGGERPPLEIEAVIYAPEPNPGFTDFSCIVHCPSLFAADKRIAGVDADQAVDLAESFMLELLAHHRFVVYGRENI